MAGDEHINSLNQTLSECGVSRDDVTVCRVDDLEDAEPGHPSALVLQVDAKLSPEQRGHICQALEKWRVATGTPPVLTLEAGMRLASVTPYVFTETMDSYSYSVSFRTCDEMLNFIKEKCHHPEQP